MPPIPAPELSQSTDQSTGPVTAGRPLLWDRPQFAFVLLGLLVLIFYWTPLTSGNTTPQWDTIDYHYCVLRYFFDSVRSGHLPYWTDYPSSGYPFLSDPQTGVWYPPNWLLFFTGVFPKTIELELAIHALLAAIGAFLFASIWVKSRWAQIAAAFFYMFSGFFTAHTSHYGMFQSAAWLPLLLFGLHRSV